MVNLWCGIKSFLQITRKLNPIVQKRKSYSKLSYLRCISNPLRYNIKINWKTAQWVTNLIFDRLIVDKYILSFRQFFFTPQLNSNK